MHYKNFNSENMNANIYNTYIKFTEFFKIGVTFFEAHPIDILLIHFSF